jgi:hypothetical protein
MNLGPGVTTTCGDQGSVMTRAYLTEALSTMVNMLVVSGSCTARWGLIPVPSAALTMAAPSGALPSAEDQALGEGFMPAEEVFMPAWEVTGNRTRHISQRHWHMPEWRKEPCYG